MSLSTPVAFMIYKRPDLTERVFAMIADARPRQLFVVADGPRGADEKAACDAARLIISKVDWDCEIRTDFSEVNLGCGQRVASGIDWVFSHVERAIFLEDDTLPAPSFFKFCEEMLSRYQDDERVMHINGDNSVNWDRTRDAYYFSKYVHSWGWASWRRAWKHYDRHMKNWPTFSQAGLLEQVCEDRFEHQYWKEIFDQMHADPKVIDTWDYQWVYAVWTQGGLVVAPTKNLISNIGFARADSTHTSAHDPRAALPVTDIWDIKHPEFVVRHREADRHSFDVIFGGAEMRRAAGG
jgi:hypothetical protein